MPFRFTDPAAFPYRSGALFLGVDPATGREVGFKTEKHAMLTAGPRTGKGVAVIIPNLLRWPESTLTVDPSGGNVRETWKALEAKGISVAVLDPFHVAEIPPRLRVSCNLLDGIDPDSRTVVEDCRMVADGMVMRYKAEDGMWDNGAVSVLAGVIGFVCKTMQGDDRNLLTVRRLLTMPDAARAELFQDMQALGGFIAAAGNTGLSTTKKYQEYVGSAVDNTEWLDSLAMAETLGASSLQLKQLKDKPTALFLVLPEKYLNDQVARFLRLFVRVALKVMEDAGEGSRPCLFILDEFYSLGRIDKVLSGAVTLPKYGVHLLPVIHNLGQLVERYGKEGAAMFFAASDVDIFFGAKDNETLKYISDYIGKLTPQEVVTTPPKKAVAEIEVARVEPYSQAATFKQTAYVHRPDGVKRWGSGQGFFEDDEDWRRRLAAEDDNARRKAEMQHGNEQRRLQLEAENERRAIDARNETARRAAEAENERRRRAAEKADADARALYDHQMKLVGQPRLTPQQVAALIAKHEGDKVARSMIVLAPGDKVLNLKLMPYFDYSAPINGTRLSPAPEPALRKGVWTEKSRDWEYTEREWRIIRSKILPKAPQGLTITQLRYNDQFRQMARSRCTQIADQYNYEQLQKFWSQNTLTQNHQTDDFVEYQILQHIYTFGDWPDDDDDVQLTL